MEKLILQEGLLEVRRDITGDTILSVGGMTVAIPPETAIKLAAGILRTQGCRVDFQGPAAAVRKVS